MAGSLQDRLKQLAEEQGKGTATVVTADTTNISANSDSGK